MELMPFCALQRTVHGEVVIRFAPGDMTRVGSNDGVLIRVGQGTVFQWFAMSICRVLRRMHCSPIPAFLAIARLVEVDSDATAIEWLPFEYEMSNLSLYLPFLG